MQTQLFNRDHFVARFTRRTSVLIALWCVGLLVFGLYLQHAQGLEPCPTCIVQRYALVLVFVLCVIAALWPANWLGGLASMLTVLMSLAGAGVAARQSWLQWFPPEMFSCGRDFYGMIEAFPLQRVIPMLLKGSGDCTAIDWTFLSLSIANWSFLNFILLALVSALIVRYRWR